jgi:hypothetical protein
MDSIDFRMSFSILTVITLTDDQALVHNHAAYHGVGRYMSKSFFGELKGSFHVGDMIVSVGQIDYC